MAEQRGRNPDSPPTRGEAARSGETFKREGPAPASNDTGGDVDEMNEKAAESVNRNVTPGDAPD